MIVACAFAMAALGFAGPDAKPADDWPVFRGNPLQTGVATSSLPERLEILWKVKPSESTDASFEGTAAISKGVVYLGSMDSTLYAFDLASGQVKWTYKTDKTKNIKVGPFKAPVSVHQGAVYVGDADGMFHCVEAASGKQLWTFDTESEVTSGASFAGESVIFGSNDETMFCLSQQGKERWRFKVPGGPVLGTPAVVGDRTFAAGCDSSLHVIDTKVGKEIGTAVNLGGQVGASVAVMGDQLYIGTMSSQVLAINWKKGEGAWEFAADSHQQAFFASAAVTDQYVVVGSRDRRVYALERKTGKPVWNFQTRNRVDSSPVIVGNRVVVGSLDSNLYVLDLEKGTELQKFKLGNNGIAASPAVAENCVVIGTTDGVVYCLGAKK
jgi:outer membrane protein assembly factor BamB